MGARRGPALRRLSIATPSTARKRIRRTGRDVAVELMAALGGAMPAAKSS
jgi:hypothetical protein